MKISRYIIGIPIIVVSAIIYYVFYLLFFPNTAFNYSITTLAKAIENNDKVAFESSINEKSLRAQSDLGSTPLSIAIRRGNIHFVEKLLANGANPNGRSDFGDSPEIIVAAGEACYPRYGSNKQNALEILKLLIRYGADVNLRNSNGETALLLAANCGDNDLTSVLVAAGGDPNIVANRSEVPLHQAIYTSQRIKDLSVVRTLIAAGANPFVRSSDADYGKTAFDIANAYHDTELIDILKTGLNQAPLKTYSDERQRSGYGARRFSSLLSEMGIGIPMQFINWINNHKLFLLLIPTCLSLLIGFIRRDNVFLVAGLVQPLIIVLGFILLLFIGASKGS